MKYAILAALVLCFVLPGQASAAASSTVTLMLPVEGKDYAVYPKKKVPISWQITEAPRKSQVCVSLVRTGSSTDALGKCQQAKKKGRTMLRVGGTGEYVAYATLVTRATGGITKLATDESGPFTVSDAKKRVKKERTEDDAPKTSPQLKTAELTRSLNGGSEESLGQFTRSKAITSCEIHAYKNPGMAVRCEWDGKLIYNNDTDSRETKELEVYVYVNGEYRNRSVKDFSIEHEEVVAKAWCLANVAIDSNSTCWWGTKQLYP